MAIGATNDPEVWSEGVLLQAYLGGRSETERLLRSFRTDVTCLYVRRPLRDDVPLERHTLSIGPTNVHGEHNTCGWSVHWPLGDPGTHTQDRASAHSSGVWVSRCARPRRGRLYTTGRNAEDRERGGRQPP